MGNVKMFTRWYRTKVILPGVYLHLRILTLYSRLQAQLYYTTGSDTILQVQTTRFNIIFYTRIYKIFQKLQKKRAA